MQIWFKLQPACEVLIVFKSNIEHGVGGGRELYPQEFKKVLNKKLKFCIDCLKYYPSYVHSFTFLLWTITWLDLFII